MGMMTREEFYARSKAYLRESAFLAVAIFFLFIDGILAFIPICTLLEKSKTPPLLGLVLLFIFFIGLCIGVSFVVAKFDPSQQKYGLLCPECQKPLTETIGKIAMATGKCWKCGAQVIGEAAGITEETRLITREEVIRWCRAYRREERHIFATLYGLIILIGLASLYLLSRMDESNPRSQLLYIAAVFVFVLAGIFLVSRGKKRQAIQPEFKCPTCGTPINTATLTTGTCGACGGQALRVVESNTEALTLLTHEEFLRRKDALLRDGFRATVFWLLSLVVIVGACCYALSHYAIDNLLLYTLLPLAVLGYIIGSIYFRDRKMRQRIKEYGLLCPTCRTQIDKLAEMTGTCMGCGARVFQEL